MFNFNTEKLEVYRVELINPNTGEVTRDWNLSSGSVTKIDVKDNTFFLQFMDGMLQSYRNIPFKVWYRSRKDV